MNKDFAYFLRKPPLLQAMNVKRMHNITEEKWFEHSLQYIDYKMLNLKKLILWVWKKNVRGINSIVNSGGNKKHHSWNYNFKLKSSVLNETLEFANYDVNWRMFWEQFESQNKNS